MHALSPTPSKAKPFIAEEDCVGKVKRHIYINMDNMNMFCHTVVLTFASSLLACCR